MPAPSEFQIHRAYVMWFCGVQWEHGPLKGQWKIEPAGLPGVVSWHTPNGGKRDAREAKLFKELGVLAGFPDVAHLWGALHLIEMKEPDGRLQTSQIELHPRLVAAGAKVAVAYSLDQAKACARDWNLVRPGC
jgi:hypothetical protein